MTGRSIHWFALTVKPQHERAVADQLQSKTLEAYVPLYSARRRWSDRVKTVEVPLFPRYVFSRFVFEERSHVLKTPGVTSIVGFSGIACPVTDAEIDVVKTMVGSGNPLKVWPAIRVGQRVRIREGAMSGLEGILVQEKTACRIVINLELLNRGVAVEIDWDMIEAVTGPKEIAGPTTHLRIYPVAPRPRGATFLAM